MWTVPLHKYKNLCNLGHMFAAPASATDAPSLASDPKTQTDKVIH